LEFSKSSSGDNYTAGDVTLSISATIEYNNTKCTCSQDQKGTYNYSISETQVQFIGMVCSNNKTSGDCSDSCYCTNDNSFQDNVIWATDCNSFTMGELVFDKSGSDWWIWVLLILAVLVIGAVIIAAVAGGIFYMRKKRGYAEL
jgi:hypothetical protein